MSFNAWANFSMNFILHELYSIATMNWIYNEWCWALSNVNVMKLYHCELYNFTWILNDIWMDVKWFNWNFNKTVEDYAIVQ